MPQQVFLQAEQVVFDKTTCFCWSEMGDSNSRHLAPKASALPTALIPDLGFEFCARCGQTCGQAVFLTISTCGGSACIAGVSRDCGHGIFRLEGGATRSQSRRATNCATPRYEIVGLPGRILPKQAYSVPNNFWNIKKQGGPDRLVGPPRSESEKGHKKLPESAAPIQC